MEKDVAGGKVVVVGGGMGVISGVSCLFIRGNALLHDDATLPKTLPVLRWCQVRPGVICIPLIRNSRFLLRPFVPRPTLASERQASMRGSTRLARHVILSDACRAVRDTVGCMP